MVNVSYKPHAALQAPPTLGKPVKFISNCMLIEEKVTYRSPKTSYRIPSLSNWECSRHTIRSVSADDICKSFISLVIQPRVQKAKRRPATGNQLIVDERDDASSQRCRCRCPGDGRESVVPGKSKLEPLSGNIGIPSSICAPVSNSIKRETIILTLVI